MKRNLLRDGVVAGVIGATAMVFWFLVVDVVRGEAFATPTFVAEMLFGGLSAAALPLWAVLHYVLFIAVGVGMAAVVRRLHIAAPILLGVALGFLLFDVTFYGSVVLTGTDVIGEVGWPVVLVGNVLAGLALNHTLHRMRHDTRPTWAARALQRGVVREGIVTGIVGGLAVALWFLALDAFQGNIFQTPSALGGLVFTGEAETTTAPIHAGWVAGYTGLHFLAFIVVGIVLAALADLSDERPPLVIGVFLALVSFQAFAMGFVALLAELIPHAWWALIGGNLLAAVAMGAILFARHPALGYGLSRDEVLAQDEVRIRDEVLVSAE